MGKTALVLGGGAPHLTLMSGALLALNRSGIKFDLVSMAGGGAVVGLLYLAPKGLDREQALENTVNFGISDAIYAACPVNYKMFSKGGASAEEFRNYWLSLPAVQAAMSQYGMSRDDKVFSDLILLAGAMMCPTDVNYFSAGFCAHAPFIEHLVDFDKLKSAPADCLLNAYCIDDDRISIFRKAQIDVHHFRAAMSFPFIHPPYRIDGKHYFEGAAYQCLPLTRLVEDEGVDNIVLIDVMTLKLIRPPRNMWDAYAQSIIVPLVANARNELALFEYLIEREAQRTDAVRPSSAARRVRLFRLEFDIPEQHRPQILDWSSSNLETMFELGFDAGRKFVGDPDNRPLFA